MDALIEWVTQIIIFLLLAAIIDLLIPATAMKKYIKLAVGLLLILILLKPVFYIFNIDMGQELKNAFVQLDQEEVRNNSAENSIEIQKNEIQASQDAYILEQVAVPLKDLAKDSLLEQYQAEIIDLEFKFASDTQATDNNLFENLEEVIVYLRELGDEEGAVSVVDDIVINTDDPSENEKGQDDEDIKDLLREVWELKNKDLTIIWEGGAS
ncbi:stage III sporulation protein AF [Virgibacillus indicus]|uniref:Stage III sporulation protein AF n=1 Tax=Virgibacillus indicus TaxID=2024554 RepID=A0A265NDW4_9BACI|nr:stage III sporulation protein AF [Virgibacillus indicus]OZU90001.1 stage III sporulation protein AF [Virgibacillus indicus]